jgi:hypothetical protein
MQISNWPFLQPRVIQEPAILAEGNDRSKETRGETCASWTFPYTISYSYRRSNQGQHSHSAQSKLIFFSGGTDLYTNLLFTGN